MHPLPPIKLGGAWESGERAANEALARKVVPSVLGSPGTVEIRLANESNTSLGLNATVTNVDFSADGHSAMLLHRNEKKVKRRRR